jgi:hypothetical protein
MKVNLEELITLNYELEGLFYLALHRGEDTPAQIWQMISDKIDGLKEGVSAIYTPEEEPAAEVAPEPEIEEAPQVEEITEPEPVEELLEEPIEELKLIDEPIVIEEPEPIDEPKLIDEPIVIEEPEPITEPEPVDEPITIAEPVKPVLPATETTINDVVTEPVRLEQKLARENSKDLRKAFSLNDRFRFRRELFGNSDTEFADTLNLIEAMNSIGEAEDYFFLDLGWDIENPEVADFMTIIRQHFANK